MATRIFGFPGQYPSGSQNLIFGDLGSSYPANCFSGQPWRFFCLAPGNNCRSVSDKCFSLTSALCFLAADAKKAIWSSYEQIWEHLWISSRIYHNPCMFDKGTGQSVTLLEQNIRFRSSTWYRTSDDPSRCQWSYWEEKRMASSSGSENGSFGIGTSSGLAFGTFLAGSSGSESGCSSLCEPEVSWLEGPGFGICSGIWLVSFGFDWSSLGWFQRDIHHLWYLVFRSVWWILGRAFKVSRLMRRRVCSGAQR